MIRAVSNVSFRAGEQDWQNLIQSEGQYTQKPTEPAKPDSVDLSSKQPEKKKSKAGKIIGGTVAGVVVAGLALYGLVKGNILKINKEAKGFAKVGHWLAEAGDWVGTKIIDPLCNIFKKGKKGADAAKDAGDAVKGAGDAGKATGDVADKAAN